jgi:hypothetical protein
MKLLSLGAALLLLAFTPGCDRVLAPPEHPIYTAWEEGLTLGYEDPSLEPGPRAQRRQQVRVKESKGSAAGWEITKTFGTLTGQWEFRSTAADGGVTLDAGGAGGITQLPAGFPDRVSRWESRGTFSWVVGRASADLPGVRLADPQGAVGIWVESFRPDQPRVRIRTFYLPDIGEAETLTLRDGRWIATNRLVSRGFTDAPAGTGKNTPGSTL